MPNLYTNIDFNNYTIEPDTTGKDALNNTHYKKFNWYTEIDKNNNKIEESYYSSLDEEINVNKNNSNAYEYNKPSPVYFYEESFYLKFNESNGTKKFSDKQEESKFKTDHSETEDREPYSEVSNVGRASKLTNGSLNRFDADTSERIKSKLQMLKLQLDEACDKNEVGNKPNDPNGTSLKTQTPLAPNKDEYDDNQEDEKNRALDDKLKQLDSRIKKKIEKIMSLQKDVLKKKSSNLKKGTSSSVGVHLNNGKEQVADAEIYGGSNKSLRANPSFNQKKLGFNIESMTNMLNIGKKSSRAKESKPTSLMANVANLGQAQKVYVQPGVQPYIVASGPEKAEIEAHYINQHSYTAEYNNEDNENTSIYEKNVRMRSKKSRRMGDLRSMSILSVGNKKPKSHKLKKANADQNFFDLNEEKTKTKPGVRASVINLKTKLERKLSKDTDSDSNSSSNKPKRKNSTAGLLKDKFKDKKTENANKTKDFIGKRRKHNVGKSGGTNANKATKSDSSNDSNHIGFVSVGNVHSFSDYESDYEAFDALSIHKRSVDKPQVSGKFKNEWSANQVSLTNSDAAQFGQDVVVDNMGQSDAEETYGSFGSRSNKSRNSLILDSILMFKDSGERPNDSMFHQENIKIVKTGDVKKVASNNHNREKRDTNNNGI